MVTARHAGLQRYLYRLLRRFAENGNQVVYASARAAAVPLALATIVGAAVGLAAERDGPLSHPVLARVSGAAQPRDERSAT